MVEEVVTVNVPNFSIVSTHTGYNVVSRVRRRHLSKVLSAVKHRPHDHDNLLRSPLATAAAGKLNNIVTLRVIGQGQEDPNWPHEIAVITTHTL